MTSLKIIKKYNVEGIDRGWETDYISLSIDDIPAGYATIRNLPYKNFAQYYSQGAYDYLRIIKHGTLLPKNISDCIYTDFLNISENKLLMKTNTQKKIEIFNSKFEKEFFNFIKENVDKPSFSFVKIYDTNDRHKDYDFSQSTPLPVLLERKNKYGNDNPSFRNKGLGNVIYCEAAIMLNEKKLTLYQSRNVTKDAQKKWQRLEEEYPHYIINKNDRKQLNGSLIKRNIYPNWIDEIIIS